MLIVFPLIRKGHSGPGEAVGVGLVLHTYVHVSKRNPDRVFLTLQNMLPFNPGYVPCQFLGDLMTATLENECGHQEESQVNTSSDLGLKRQAVHCWAF